MTLAPVLTLEFDSVRNGLHVLCGCGILVLQLDELTFTDIWSDGLMWFFFQAEDGIRDLTVTGVQTCALPISALASAHELGYGGVSLGWVYGNRVNLIARNAFALVLENQIFVVEGEIALGILAAKRELPNMAKMLGLFRDRRSAEGCRSWRNRVSNRPTTEQAGGGYRDK